MAPLLRSWAPLLAVRFLPVRTTGIQLVSLPETRKTWRQPETADFQELSIQPLLRQAWQGTRRLTKAPL